MRALNPYSPLRLEFMPKFMINSTLKFSPPFGNIKKPKTFGEKN